MCTWNLKFDTNELIYKTETDSDCQGSDGGGGESDDLGF